MTQEWMVIWTPLTGYKYYLMDIGSSVAVFLVLSLILLALFCLLTKYFHHKLTQNIQEAAQIYSVVDELGNQNQSELDGNYQKYKEQQHEKKQRAQNKNKAGYEEIEMAIIKSPLIQNQDDDIYSANILRNRLNNDSNPLKIENMQMESNNRSMSYLKQFKPDKMITTNRSNGSHRDPEDPKSARNNYQDDLTQHTFVNKLVCYDSQGITVIQVNVTSIRKLAEGSFKLNKTVRNEMALSNQSSFDGYLEIYGFERGEFGCCKFSTKVEINNMKPNEDYDIRSLKTCEIKQVMEIEEYLGMKLALELGI